jgi:hypothetical protein
VFFVTVGRSSAATLTKNAGWKYSRVMTVVAFYAAQTIPSPSITAASAHSAAMTDAKI